MSSISSCGDDIKYSYLLCYLHTSEKKKDKTISSKFPKENST